MPIAGPGCRNASAHVRRLVGERHRVPIASRRAHHVITSTPTRTVGEHDVTAF